MLSFVALMYFAAIILGYAAATTLLLCPWLARAARHRLPFT